MFVTVLVHHQEQLFKFYKNFVHLVGLYTYGRMMHCAYVKLSNIYIYIYMCVCVLACVREPVTVTLLNENCQTATLK
jgi:hypothetical protein